MATVPAAHAGTVTEELLTVRVAGALSGVVQLTESRVGALRLEAARLAGVEDPAAIKLICCGKTLAVRGPDATFGDTRDPVRRGCSQKMRGRAAQTGGAHPRPAWTGPSRPLTAPPSNCGATARR